MGSEFEGFTAGQLISFASEVTVNIVPRVPFPQLKLITGVVGPLSPGVSSQVPFWLFEFLHQTRRCTLEPPDWLSPQELSNLIQEEEGNDRSFAALPTKHFFTIVYKLLNIADSEIPQISVVRSHVETLRLLRFSKLQRMLLEDLFTAPSAIQLPNISQEEINYFRPFLNTPQEILQSLEEAEERSDRSEGSKKMEDFQRAEDTEPPTEAPTRRILRHNLDY